MPPLGAELCVPTFAGVIGACSSVGKYPTGHTYRAPTKDIIGPEKASTNEKIFTRYSLWGFDRYVLPYFQFLGLLAWNRCETGGF
jgi:hypothetical protein